ncbi:alkaline phosphatase family protein [Aliivibrio finisterrensis]|uniref:LTA synthase family protein n=1 Tax=Aliivibrio finisterrensis TaxID=511998 RepID=UPI00101FA4AF|nr:alkaline phosphatase family protein [Aliivibrio finisterrensis]RYU67856.1 alkaline phosphatase family protein [Aliivibrio finisterrensis]RYU71515.1 alkaline phosphatase family protein [Aliivibrio finisterrensis]RYU74677.1 alkaline phosphatase family protein [Aliivibrio finisterrensis]
MNFQQNFKQLSRTIWLSVFIATAIMSVSRLVFLANIGDMTELVHRGGDLWRALFTGLRFDLKIAAIGFAPLFLIGLAVAAFPRLYRTFSTVIPWYAGLIFFIVTSFSIGNYYYYLTYGNYIDVFVFGLADDDTQAVLANAWADYPIFISFVSSGVVAFVFAMLVRAAVKKMQQWAWKPQHKGMTTVSIIVMILTIFFFARGTLGSHPLKRYHAQVSDYKVLNSITPNGIIALEWAKSDYKKQSQFHSVSQSELEAQFNKVVGNANGQFITPKNPYLAQNKPHVVMALMEGMGTNVLVEDNYPENDLLGELRPAFESDFVFKRFLAETPATINSLVNMLGQSNVPTISHSSAQKVEVAAAAARPYKNAGYKTLFITATNGMWRNVANYLPAQGFDEILDENAILKAFPEAEAFRGEWGLSDEYAFKLAEKELKEATQPLMIYILTITNHTPYEVPKNYDIKPLKVSEQLLGRMQKGEEEAMRLLETYQYANNALGEFIADIKQSSLGDSTLIAATGDHKLRGFTMQYPDDLAIINAVPFYLYVPEKIQQQVPYLYDEKRVGSHKDIFPTLYAFSLSEATYYSLGGENMLSTADTNRFGYNPEMTLIEQGIYINNQPDRLYPWASEVAITPESIPNNGKLLDNDYHTLQTLYINSQVKGAH